MALDKVMDINLGGFLCGGLICYGVYRLGSYLSNARAFYKTMQIAVSVPEDVKVNKKDSTLSFTLKINIQNPTRFSATIQKPYAQIKYQDKILATTDFKHEKIKIYPQMTTCVPMSFTIPLLSNAGTFAQIGKNLFSNLKNLKFDVKSIADTVSNNANKLLSDMTVVLQLQILRFSITKEVKIG